MTRVQSADAPVLNILQYTMLQGPRSEEYSTEMPPHTQHDTIIYTLPQTAFGLSCFPSFCNSGRKGQEEAVSFSFFLFCCLLFVFLFSLLLVLIFSIAGKYSYYISTNPVSPSVDARSYFALMRAPPSSGNPIHTKHSTAHDRRQKQY